MTRGLDQKASFRYRTYPLITPLITPLIATWLLPVTGIVARSRIRSPRIAVAVLILSACLSISPSRAKEEFRDWQDPTPADWAVAENPDLNIHHAVILSDHSIIDEARADPDRWIRGDEPPYTVYSRYVRIRLLDDKGVEDNRTVELPYTDGMKFRRVAARTLKANGEVLPVEENDIFDKTIVSYSKRKVKARVFAFKGLEAGDIIEYQFTIRFDDLDPPAIHLRGRAYVIDSQVRWVFFPRPRTSIPTTDAFEAKRIRKELGYVPNYVIPNGKEFGGTVTEFSADKEIKEGIVVTFQNIPPNPEEPYISSPYEAAVTFVPFYAFPLKDAEESFWDRISSTWGKGANEFLDGQDDLPNWMAEISAKPRSFERDLRDCFDLIHSRLVNADYLDQGDARRKFSDVSNINDLLDRGIGWGWQMDDLLVAMLHRLGYQATLFSARDIEEGPFIPEWHSWRQFTTWGVAAKDSIGTLRFLMPGIAGSSPDALPWQIGGSQALLTDLTEGKKDVTKPFPSLAAIPVQPEDRNVHTISAMLDLDAGGSLSGILRCRLLREGYPYWTQELREKLRKERESAFEVIRPELIDPSLNPAFRADSVRLDADEVQYACSLRVEGLAQEAGNTIAIQLGKLRHDRYSMPEGRREMIIDFHHPRDYVTDVALHLPEGVTVVDLPEAVQITRGFASYEQQFSVEGGTVRVHRRLRIPHDRFLPKAAEEFRAFFLETDAAAERPVLLRREAGQ